MSERVTSAASYGASAVAAGAAGLTFNEWIMLVSLLLAALTFLVNWIYQHRSYELKKRKYLGVNPEGCSECATPKQNHHVHSDH